LPTSNKRHRQTAVSTGGVLMARKRVWLSWLPDDQEPTTVKDIVQILSRSGLDVDGAGWNRDLKQVGWLQTAQPLTEIDKADVWLIAGHTADFTNQAVRYGLSLASVTVAAKRGAPLATILASTDAGLDDVALPSFLADSRRLGPPIAAWGAKTIAAAMRPVSAADKLPFRLSVIAHPSLGHWFEIGPKDGESWSGALLGVDDGEITHQGVGANGALPEHCTLEYPSQGLKVETGGRTYTCWSVKNEMSAGTSYFARVVGSPAHLLLGEHPDADESEMWVLDLI
jgi:hypothetical protein